MFPESLSTRPEAGQALGEIRLDGFDGQERDQA
jgi:hypothetical protein